METQQDAAEVLETQPTEETTETVAETETTETEDIEALRAKAAKADELEKKNKQLFERLKKQQEPKPEPVADNLSNKDILILAKADVHEDDIDEVLEYAKFKKVSVAEALKAPVIKTLIQERAEERKTANATTTKSARGTSKVSGEELLAKAERGQEVDLTDDNANAIFLARLARKVRK